jgi:hypothetical protein
MLHRVARQNGEATRRPAQVRGRRITLRFQPQMPKLMRDDVRFILRRRLQRIQQHKAKPSFRPLISYAQRLCPRELLLKVRIIRKLLKHRLVRRALRNRKPWRERQQINGLRPGLFDLQTPKFQRPAQHQGQQYRSHATMVAIAYT